MFFRPPKFESNEAAWEAVKRIAVLLTSAHRIAEANDLLGAFSVSQSATEVLGELRAKLKDLLRRGVLPRGEARGLAKAVIRHIDMLWRM